MQLSGWVCGWVCGVGWGVRLEALSLRIVKEAQCDTTESDMLHLRCGTKPSQWLSRFGGFFFFRE